jgi:large subunit ribosomal protein L46
VGTGSSRHPRVCSDCINHIARTSAARGSQRSYSSPAAPKVSDNASQPLIQNIPPVETAPRQYTIKSGVLLSRPPLLTRPLTAFEKAFFFYQKRLNERLVMPFSRYFYFKKDTPADHDWKLKAKDRSGAPARELGGYNPYGELGWNDELLVGDQMSETSYMVDTLVKDAEVRAVEGKDGKPMEAKEGSEERGKVEKPLGALTEADKMRDVRRLDRKLARTLYLVVKRENGGWGFPAGELVGRENLHQVGLVFVLC